MVDYNTGYPTANYQNGSYTAGMYNRPSYAAPVPYQQTPMPMNHTGDMRWADGEVAARAQPFPQNWPVETPMVIWDTNSNTFYLKSLDSYGRPMPMRIAHFTWVEQEQQSLLPGKQNDNYVTKEDFEKFKKELMSSRNYSNDRNGGRE